VAWVKDTQSQSPKTVYIAPEGSPFTQVIYDPNAANPWSVVFPYLQSPSDTQASIEALIGV
jgi:hypothetical protein